MNSKELIAELARRTGQAQKDTASMLAVSMECLVGRLNENTSFVMQGFGTLEVRKKNIRTLVNPATGQNMTVPPKLSLNFKVGNTYKAKLKNKPSDGE
ncbi:MAG: HU family DNA-binding protein [Paludibacteraceae bacterium]|nr:HU family DNA-binding protein [Paludibacteraceae bacterium]